jgi:hypothetical protein
MVGVWPGVGYLYMVFTGVVVDVFFYILHVWILIFFFFSFLFFSFSDALGVLFYIHRILICWLRDYLYFHVCPLPGGEGSPFFGA